MKARNVYLVISINMVAAEYLARNCIIRLKCVKWMIATLPFGEITRENIDPNLIY